MLALSVNSSSDEVIFVITDRHDHGEVDINERETVMKAFLGICHDEALSGFELPRVLSKPAFSLYKEMLEENAIEINERLLWQKNSM